MSKVPVLLIVEARAEHDQMELAAELVELINDGASTQINCSNVHPSFDEVYVAPTQPDADVKTTYTLTFNEEE